VSDSHPEADLPLRVRGAEAFAELRALFRHTGFTAEGVRAHLGLDSLFDFAPGQHARAADETIESALDVWIRLFMDAGPVPTAQVVEHLGADGRDLLASFGLLVSRPDDDRQQIASVLMYPTPGPWLVSDRSGADSASGLLAQPGSAAPLRPDAVYPALTASAGVFLTALPTGPVDAFLELCSGTGVAALMAASAGARQVWAVDVSRRATAFADFNARLNGIENLTALEGDLWAPLHGRTFDIIVAHPPYVPSAEPEYIYRDGGQDGEQITVRVLAGLPEHLAPGGCFQCTAAMSSRKGAGAPQRIRGVLGVASDEFDLVFVRHGRIDLTDHFRSRLVSSDRDDAARAAAQLRHLDALDIEELHFCTIVLRRHAEDRAGFTVQLEGGGRVAWDDLAWALDLGAAVARPEECARRLLEARVRLSPAARLDVTYRPGREGEQPWVPAGGRVGATRPFRSSVAMEMVDATILADFDGSRTLGEEFRRLQADGRIPPETTATAFATSFVGLVWSGVVESAAFPRSDAVGPA
jgi:methylase of polypeptide subunit release factors